MIEISGYAHGFLGIRNTNGVLGVAYGRQYMTCIVGYVKNKKVFMGGDSAGVSGLDIIDRKDSKVFKTGEFLIGYTSSFRMGQIIRFKLKVNKQKPSQGDYEYMCTTFIDSVRKLFSKEGFSEVCSNKESGGTFLVGYRGALYQVYDDFQVAESLDNYSAAGCGTKYALGALAILKDLEISSNKKVETALKTAVKFSGGVRPPFTIMFI